MKYFLISSLKYFVDHYTKIFSLNLIIEIFSQETALDFWRMVVEHNVATMVMLSGSDDSWQYWPGDEGERTLSFGYMTVTLVNRESRVSYVKREFKVSNTKVLFISISSRL